MGEGTHPINLPHIPNIYIYREFHGIVSAKLDLEFEKDTFASRAEVEEVHHKLNTRVKVQLVK